MRILINHAAYEPHRPVRTALQAHAALDRRGEARPGWECYDLHWSG